MPTSPSVQNYRIGKGIVSFKETGTSTFVDLGNSPSFVYTPAVTKKEHFSSREGIKTKDFTAVTEIGATVKVTLDEITAENLAMFALGDLSMSGTTGTITGLTKAEFTGTLKVVGTNDIGQQVDWTGDIAFVPSGDFSFITDADDFNSIVLDAEVQKSTDGSFGTWTVREQVPARHVTAATVAAGGTGYAVGNTINLANGVVLTVATVTSGAVATTTITNSGSFPGAPATLPTNPQAQVSTSGSGTGATFNLTWV